MERADNRGADCDYQRHGGDADLQRQVAVEENIDGGKYGGCDVDNHEREVGGGFDVDPVDCSHGHDECKPQEVEGKKQKYGLPALDYHID